MFATIKFNKRIFGVVLIQLFFNYLYAQQIIKSDYRYLKNKKSSINWAGKTQDKFVFTFGKNDFDNQVLYVERYDDSMKMIDEFKVRSKSKHHKILHAEAHEDYLTLFTKKHDIIRTCNSIYIEKFNYSGKPIGEPQLINKTLLKSYTDDGEYIVDQSPNKEYTLLFHTDYNELGNFVLSMVVLNIDGKIISDTVLDPGFKSDLVDIEEIQIDNRGNLFILTTEFIDTIYSKTSKNFKHSIHYYHILKKELLSYSIPNENYYIKQSTFNIDTIRNQLIIQGLYGSDESSLIQGVFYLSYDMLTHKIQDEKSHPFTNQDRLKILGQKIYSFSSDLKDYYIKHLYKMSNGSTILTAERYFTSQQSTSYFANGTMQTAYRTVFNYHEILLVCMDSVGNLLWKQIIPKNQSTLNDDGIFSSYICFDQGNSLHFYYNKMDKKQSSIMYYKVSPSGAMDYIQLTEDHDEKMLVPVESRQADSIRLLLIIQEDKNFGIWNVKHE